MRFGKIYIRNKESTHKINNEFSVYFAIIIKFMVISYVLRNLLKNSNNRHTLTWNIHTARILNTTETAYIYVGLYVCELLKQI